MSDLPERIKLDELEWAFDMCSGSEMGDEIHAYVCKKTGAIVYDDENVSGEPCPVEDIDCHDDYVHVPDKYDLDLGTPLVWKFIAQQIPELEPKVRELFSRRGAYRRWKKFLENINLLEAWYDFENESTRQALLDWCERKKLPITK
ncbi:UPF0158 family protein [Coraliomargarita sp. W4R72]